MWPPFIEQRIQLDETRIAAAAQEAAEAPLLDIGDIRRANAARLNRNQQSIVQIAIRDLDDVEREVRIDLVGIAFRLLAEPARVRIDECPELQLLRRAVTGASALKSTSPANNNRSKLPFSFFMTHSY